MSVRLYIGNLPKEEVDRQELQAIFADAGDAVTTKIIKDRKTGKCRGFGFVTVNNDDQADEIIEKYNGSLFKDTPIKIEKALPRTKGQEEEEQQTSAPSNVGGNTSGSNNVEKSPKRRDRNNKKQRRPAGSSSNQTNDSETVRPDPRWAAELEKLKQMLAAQTTNG